MITLFIILIGQSCFAAYDPCKYLKLNSCGNTHSINKGLGASRPTSSSSFSSPASMASVKGFGVEAITWDGFEFSFVTGNGKVGAGVSSSNSDDTFFGNTAKELTEDYEGRIQSDNGKYKSKKYTFATALSLYKTKKGFFSINLGLIGKYVEETSNIHLGGGLGLSLGPLNLGYSRFKDEGTATTLDSNSLRTATEFYVDSYSLGLNLPFITFDYTLFTNRISTVEKVHIYSGGFFYRKFIFSYGRKLEISDRRKYDFENKAFYTYDRKWSSFAGVQYKFKKKWVAGLLSNYYLNQELSLILTGFF
ncbi:hypothetical protein A9Q84_00660 [Halobacteriovorax marinus]|uniref:Uncharacterized protein n=1 Tax=Halobacteriovorax marinus TaxID=97084 RepID=A0A1Y5FHA3_9BACT|nr:hypothetical protein A9Q84_00660 [Halobacteriovorax marinus]